MQSLQESTQQIEQQALARFYDGAIDEAIEILNAPLAAGSDPAFPPADRARLLAVQGKLNAHKAFLLNSGCDEAMASLNEAVEIAQSLDQEQTLGLALCYRGFARYTNRFHNNVGEFADALPDIERSLEVREGLEDHAGIAESLIYQGILYERTDQTPLAKANYQRAAQLSNSHGHALEESYAVRHLAFLRQNEGDLAGALEFFERSLELRQNVGFRIGLALSHFSLAGVLLELERFGDAQQHLVKSSGYASEFGLKRVLTLCHYLLGEAHAAQGDGDAAISELQRSMELSREIGYEVGIKRAQSKLAELGQSAS